MVETNGGNGESVADRAERNRQRRVMLWDDVVADWTWPMLLRAPKLALSPSRWLLGIVFVVLAWAIMGAAEQLTASETHGGVVSRFFDGLLGNGIGAFRDGIGVETPGLVGVWLAHAAVGMFAEAFSMGWFEGAVMVGAIVVYVMMACVVGGGISRMAAAEHAKGQMMTWTEGVGFGLAKWKSMFGALVMPWVLVLIIGGVMALAGWVLFSIPGVRVVGGVVYGLFLMGGVLAAAVIVGLAVGKYLLIPAVACEGCDWLDALQRVLGYVYARPVRVIGYLLTVFVQGVVIVAVVWVVATTAVSFTHSCASGLLSERNEALFDGRAVPVVDADDAEEGEADEAEEEVAFRRSLGGRLVDGWEGVVMLVVAGYAVSYLMCGFTLTYLCVRRIGDGQDTSEIWMP